MGENAKKIGEKLEGFGEKLFQRFGWEELTRDEEIKCTKLLHKTVTDRQKRTHGVDLYHKCYEPYKNKSIGIVTECKNYEWKSITTASIQKWFEQLVGTIECVQVSEELSSKNAKCDSVNTGLLLINANDGKYDDEVFRTYLKGLAYKSRRNPINIFIASNRELEKWNAMFSFIENE